MMNENSKALWEIMVGIAVLIFTVYSGIKDFMSDKRMAMVGAVIFTVILVSALAIFNFITKNKKET